MHIGRRSLGATLASRATLLLAVVWCAPTWAEAPQWAPQRTRSSAAGPAISTTPPALAPGHYLLDLHHEAAPGDPPFVLRDATGAVARFVEPTLTVKLDGLVGRAVRIRHDTGNTLLATQLDLGPAPPRDSAALAPLAGLAPLTPVTPAQHLSADPTEPIILEELPPGRAPLAQPLSVTPAAPEPPPIGAGQAYPQAAPVDGYYGEGPACGDACLPYNYSGSPGTLATDLAHLGSLDWWLTAPFAWLPKSRPGEPWRIEFGGWTQLGYHSDSTPLSQIKGDRRAFNDVPSGIRLQQQWLWIGRKADGSAGPDWGFRFDVLFGTDAQKAQSFGNVAPGTPYGVPRDTGSWDASWDHGHYGWAMPQLYGEIADGDWSVMFGHFLTPVGYEVLPAPDNFFYSHSLTMFNSEPFTHTGVLGAYAPCNHPGGLELYLGYTLGWDTGFDQTAGGSTFIGGWSVRPLSSITLAYLTTIGNLGARSGGGSGYTHSIVADVAVTQRMTYVLQTDFVDYNDATGSGLRNDQIGVNNYLLYALSPCWGAGARLEWWKTDGDSYYEMTYGLNYRPLTGLVLRPELRYDWTAGGPLGADRLTLGIDAVLVY